MPPQIIRSFCGNLLNTDDFSAGILNANEGPAAKVIFIEEAQEDSVDAGTFTVEQRAIDIAIRIKNYANRVALAEQIGRYFKRGKRGNLVGGFHDGVDYQIDARVVSLEQSQDQPTVWIVHLVSGNTLWRAVDPDVDMSWTPSGAGGTHTVTVLGSDETRLSLTLLATAAPAGIYLYQDIVQLVNVPGVNLGYRSFCITLDTAALITAGKMNADCSDLRLFDRGTQINRFITDPNTNHTHIWFNVPLAAGFALTLRASVKQIETATAVGAITGTGNATVIVTAAGMTGSPKTFSVSVTNGDTEATWAGKVRAALAGDAAMTAVFAVGGVGATIILTRLVAAANDPTTNISLANGTCAGITAAPSSTNTTAGAVFGIASSGSVTYLQFNVDKTTRALIKAIPSKGVVVHGTEWFTYKGKNLSTCRLMVAQRGAYGTTQQAHVGGDTFNFIEHPIIMYYGNAAATDPALDDTTYYNTQPPIDLAASDGTKLVWTASTLFRDPDFPNKPFSWSFFQSRKGLNSHVYSITADAASGNPALGIKAAAYLKGGSWAADTVLMGWMFSAPGGIHLVDATGRSYRTNSKWPATTKLQSSVNGGRTWLDVFTEATPGSAGSFSNWPAHTSVAVNSASTMLRLVISGLSDSVANSYQLLEALTFTAYWTSANIPSLTLLGETSNYHLDLRVTNQVTLEDQVIEDSVELRLPMQIGIPLVLDGEAFEATYHGVNAHSAMTLDDPSRSAWWRMLPGVNTVTIESISNTDIGALDATISNYRRSK